MKKLALLATTSLLVLTGCGGSNLQYHKECHEAGGEVTVVGSQATCLKDGAVIAKWVEYRE